MKKGIREKTISILQCGWWDVVVAFWWKMVYLFRREPDELNQWILKIKRTTPDSMKPNPFKNTLMYNCHVGKGWMGVIKNMYYDIMEYDLDPYFEILQIKEKFGGLRVYTGFFAKSPPQEVLDIIAEAEAEAYETCEYCGAKENVTTEGGWIKTLCDDCRKNANSA